MFLISIMVSFFYLILSVFINLNWINDIACYLGYPLALYLVIFIALIPGFIYLFMLINLLWEKKEKKGCSCVGNEEDVTVLIPVYNAKDSIKDTIESIKKQNYCGKINIIVIDDGSVDNSMDILKKMEIDENMILLERPHQGKAQALNEGLKLVKTEYMITIDSDTILHKDAIRNIMDKLVNSNQKVVATAG